MKAKHLPLVLLLFVGSFVSAQVVKSPTALRMLQTASTLLEAKQFEAAEDYYKSGLLKAKQRKDLYCEALANEGLANLYIKMEQPDKAVGHYKSAIKLYKVQHQYVVVAVLENLLKSAQGLGDVYAGIEVGAKGIKLSVIDVKLSMDREYGYTLLLDTTINTDAASLSYQSEKETTDALVVLLDIIENRFQIPSNKVYAVISSGLKQELDKYRKTDYFANVIRPQGMDSAIKISSVTPVEEAELSVLGIVPQKQRYTAGQLDVGSGNTKGGFFNNKREFTPFTFPLGTKSFQRLIEYHGGSNPNDIVSTGEQLLADSLALPLRNVLAGKTEIKLKDVVYLSGGIVWSIVSLLHPESANKNYTEISATDIAQFRQRISTNYDDMIKPNLSTIYNAEEAKIASKNISRVLKTYDQKAITAGAVLLDHLVQEMSTYNPSKKYIYFKYAYVGWISGYIIKKVTKQYM
jgi:tetratricopeptide (TPR) repeat protein